MMGKTDHGEEVWLTKRAADSDLVIYLNINLVPMDGGHKSVAVGLSPYASLRHHHNPTTLRDSHSYMDPNHSALHRSRRSHGARHQSQLNVFTSKPPSTTTCTAGCSISCIKTRTASPTGITCASRDFSGRCATCRMICAARCCAATASPYGMTGIWAGETEAVHRKALARKFFSNTRCR